MQEKKLEINTKYNLYKMFRLLNCINAKMFRWINKIKSFAIFLHDSAKCQQGQMTQKEMQIYSFLLLDRLNTKQVHCT